jgi:TusA-related sulfurtransferase
MTFVRAKLAVERLSEGQTLEIRLNPGEPLANVPRTLTEHGHVVFSVEPEAPDAPTGPHRLMVRRA